MFMKRFAYILILVAMLGLAACSGNAEPTATATVPAPTATAVITAPTVDPNAPHPTLGALGSPTECTIVGLLPDPVAGLPEVNETDHLIGNPNAKVTIIEYSDFQCPGCAAIAPVLPQLVERYPNDIRVIYRHFPLSIHPLAPMAARASEAAGLQGKFWEMNEALFTNQGTWAAMDEAGAKQWMLDQAAALGLDTTQFAADLDSEAVTARVNKDLQDSLTLQLGGTPTVYINGLPYNFQYIPSVDEFSAVIEQVKGVLTLDSRIYKSCPTVVIDPAKSYTATLKTTKGDIVINLFADKAPLAVNSFVFLAREGWFDNAPFHRVLQGFVAQAGDPSGTGMGGPGYEFANEVWAGLSYDKAGVLGMANAGADTNGSQFFITLAPATDLDGGYTIFGQVTEESMAVVNSLTVRDPSAAGALPDPDLILSVTIAEK
jgi:cyclophilin family peptidyl-prolyl cis-trans isomerase/protein-disulfide isomerase